MTRKEFEIQKATGAIPKDALLLKCPVCFKNTPHKRALYWANGMYVICSICMRQYYTKNKIRAGKID